MRAPGHAGRSARGRALPERSGEQGCGCLRIPAWAGQRAGFCLLGSAAADRRRRAFGPDLLGTGLHNRKPERVCFVLLRSLADKAEG